MDTQKKAYIEERLKSVASSGNKAHVISKEGQWVIVKEGSARATATYTNRKSAINRAKKILLEGKVETLVVHRKDGSIFSIESLVNTAI